MDNAARPRDMSAGPVGAVIPADASDNSPRTSLVRRWVSILERSTALRSGRLATMIRGGLPLFALAVSASVLVVGRGSAREHGLIDLAALAVILLAGVRQTVLVHERGRLLRESARARGELEEALIQRAEADSRYRVLVERVPAAVYIDVADPSVSDGGRLAYMSPQIEAIVGYPPDAFLADPELWPRLIHPDDRKIALAAYVEHWATEAPLRADYRMIAQDGSVVWVHDEAYSMTEGAVVGGRRVSQGLLVDTTNQKTLEAQLLHDALHDPLTGLANRVLFADHVERALASRSRGRTQVALLFLDLDDFKVVNDTLGHRAGDRLLIEVARRLSEATRAGDIAARQGGDEFTVLLDRVHGVEDAVASAARLATALSRPIELEGLNISITVSIGIALASDENNADDLLAHADAAMYAAKAQGKARHAVFDPSMRGRTQSRLAMEPEIRVGDRAVGRWRYVAACSSRSISRTKRSERVIAASRAASRRSSTAVGGISSIASSVSQRTRFVTPAPWSRPSGSSMSTPCWNPRWTCSGSGHTNANSRVLLPTGTS